MLRADRSWPDGTGGARIHRDGELVVGALVAVNAFGDLRGQDRPSPVYAPRPLESTTLAVVATNGRLTRSKLPARGAVGPPRARAALEPVDTEFDGDAAVAAATGEVATQLEVVRLLAARAVEDAVRAALGPRDAG